MTEPPIATAADFVGYRIEEQIGRGGMGVVYRAYDLRLKRLVALKLIAPEFALDSQFRERFAEETELAMSLEHPNVVPIHDAGDVDGRLYLAMRLVDSDLRKVLRTDGALGPARALAICVQAAAALDAAHANGLVHRDVKPSNVLLDANDHVYLADFGLTRRLDGQGAPSTVSRPVGTPAYLAPEQIEGELVDGRADVYGLGCVLFECLAGSPPFARGSQLETAWAHLEEEPPTPRMLAPGLPEAIDDVVRTALAKEPDDRYPTCAALISAAEEACGLRRAPALRRQKALLVVGAIVVGAFVAAAALALVVTGGGHARVGAPLFARPDSLVRIDPATDKVIAVIDVGSHPAVAAAGGRSVWVYNKYSATISEVDTRTNRVVRTTSTHGSIPARCCSVFAGPVLAADASGAWFVNGGSYDQPRLTHIPAGGGRNRVYPLDLTPTGVAVGGDAVWVVGHRGPEHQVLRIDPATGRVTATTRFPARARVDSIAFGFGRVWVISSQTATAYRIDPRSARRSAAVVAGTSTRATRPEIDRYRHDVEFHLTAHGGSDWSIDPSTLTLTYGGSYAPADWGEYNGDFGALWWYDWPSGAVNRQEAPNVPPRTIHVTASQPEAGGPCLTSIAAGSGSIWVTAAAGTSPNGGVCVR
jgi:serine/threonine-protein kinase